jgi:DNA-binding beta-propeller fold protein YncE
MGWAHSVRIDKADNIWTVDNGTNLVAKFDPQGHLLMTLGRRGESAGIYSPQLAPGELQKPSGANPEGFGMFFEPTDVAWDAQGNIFVSDGYKNSRIQKFDKDGHFVKTWGERGSGPGQLNLPHSIAVDATGKVYVADRGNHRIQVFDNDGRFLSEWPLRIRVEAGHPQIIPNLGTDPDGIIRSHLPNSICITDGPRQVMYMNDIIPGRVYQLSLDGKILARVGQEGRKVGQFGWIHMVACGHGLPSNEVFVAEMINMRVQKVTFHPEKGNTPKVSTP